MFVNISKVESSFQVKFGEGGRSGVQALLQQYTTLYNFQKKTPPPSPWGTKVIFCLIFILPDLQRIRSGTCRCPAPRRCRSCRAPGRQAGTRRQRGCTRCYSHIYNTVHCSLVKYSHIYNTVHCSLVKYSHLQSTL